MLIPIGTYPEFMAFMPGLVSYKTKRTNVPTLVAQQGGIGAMADPNLFRIVPAGSETTTLGPLSFVWYDGGGISIGHSDWIVVPALPGVLTAAERSAIALALLTLADGIEPNITLQSALKITNAWFAGKVNGGPFTWHFRDPNDTLDRVSVDLTGGGGRTSVALDLG